jgi:putative oxidoreductase
MHTGRLLLRAAIGGLFIGHGTQKLFGWFGGQGPDGTAQVMDSLRLHPPKRNALAAGAAEAGGGALLALGLATPLAATALIGTMITAIRKVHLKNGPWVTQGGYEYNVVLIAALVALVDGGPGRYSLDRVLGIHDTGPAWALGALAAGAAASTAVIEVGTREAESAAKHKPAESDLTEAETHSSRS